MARPKVFDYDPAHDETIVTEGVTGFELWGLWVSIKNEKISLVIDEGSLAADGQSVETVTKGRQQTDLSEAEAIGFYQDHKAAFDEIFGAALELVAVKMGKTGLVNA